jgi:putative PIN family toxin of toxin-antitoxin system
MKTEYFVIDTNVLISAFLIRSSVSALALDLVVAKGRIVLSQACLDEFIEVLFRKKLDPYFADERERMEIVEVLESNSVLISPGHTITECRDEKDNKFLELAVASDAAFLISGDKDLLVLNPFRGVKIVTPAEFIEHQKTSLSNE